MGGPRAPGPGTRTVIFAEKPLECHVYERTRIAPGDTLNGPAIIEEFGATTVVFPINASRRIASAI